MVVSLMLCETEGPCRLFRATPCWCRSVFWSTFKTCLQIQFHTYWVTVLLSPVWLFTRPTSQSPWVFPRILISFNVKIPYNNQWLPFPNFITFMLLPHPKNQIKQIKWNILFFFAGYSHVRMGGTGREKGQSFFGAASCWFSSSACGTAARKVCFMWRRKGFNNTWLRGRVHVPTNFPASESLLLLCCFWSLSDPSKLHSTSLIWWKISTAKTLV